MSCGEKQGHPVMPLHGGGAEFGASRMCGCEDEHRVLPCPMASIISVPNGICGCQRRRFHSKKERIEMPGGIHMESLKCELEGVEEELKDLQIE